jgi:DNA polymerase-3 subunit epsilon
MRNKQHNELLWVFTQLPDSYIVLDTETTGLPDEDGFPDIITLGLTVVRDQKISETTEFKIRPQKPISPEAQSIHGISNQQAATFESFESQWEQVAGCLTDQLVVIHNASFDWPILLDHVARYNLTMPPIKGVFCSQKAAIPWAQANDLDCSHRGPSLDLLTDELGVEDLRSNNDGIHGARIDSLQTALVIDAITEADLGNIQGE